MTESAKIIVLKSELASELAWPVISGCFRGSFDDPGYRLSRDGIQAISILPLYRPTDWSIKQRNNKLNDCIS